MAVTGLVLLVVVVVVGLGRLTCAEPVRVPSSSVCPVNSLTDSVIQFLDLSCPFNGDQSIPSADAVSVTEVDEVSLQRVLGLVHCNSQNHIALLLYASWCSFSGSFRPSFSILSTVYPSIPHFAIEESVIKPRTLTKFRVHGFPTLLLNSTMRVRYHGSWTLGSLVAFYNDVTGLMTAPLDGKSLERIQHSSDQEEKSDKLESYEFSWARYPDNLLWQETYLALATAFVLLRLLFFIFSTLSVCTQWAWRGYIQNTGLRSLWEQPLSYLNRATQLFNSSKEPGLRSLWEQPLSYLNRATQLFNSSKEPGRRSNLQDGALNAKAWASKSLASVSFGDASTIPRGPVLSAVCALNEIWTGVKNIIMK